MFPLVKKIFFIFLFFQIGNGRDSNAAVLYWVGGTGSWSQSAHWSSISGGSGGSVIPSASDTAIINNLSGDGTLTLDVDASVLDFHIQNTTASNFTLNFNGRSLSSARDCLFDAGRFIQARNSILSCARNLDTFGVNFNYQNQGQLSVHLLGTGYWRYKIENHTTPKVFNLVAAQSNFTTALKAAGPGYQLGSSDIDVENQIRLGSGTLIQDVTEAPGATVVIEIHNQSDKLDVISSGARVTIGSLEHELTGAGTIQSNVLYNIGVFDLTGGFGAPVGQGPTWSLNGSLNLGAATLAIQKTGTLNTAGFNLSVGRINIGGSSDGTGELVLGNSTVTVTGVVNVGSGPTQGGRLNVQNGLLIATSLSINTEGLVTGNNSTIEISDGSTSTLQTLNYPAGTILTTIRNYTNTRIIFGTGYSGGSAPRILSPPGVPAIVQ